MRGKRHEPRDTATLDGAMRVSSKLAVQLLEAIERTGIPREDVMSELGLDAVSLHAPRARIEWETLTRIVERAWNTFERDPERMRDVGRALARAPSYVFLQRLARTVVSVRGLYEMATRWGSHANFPHCKLAMSIVSDRRLRYVCSIPEPHTPSAAFFHVFEGVLLETPTLLGLAPSTIITSEVTPRSIDIVLELPEAPSIRGRVRRAVRAMLYSGDALDLLEDQRHELEEGLLAVQRSTGEFLEVFDRLPVLVIIHRDGIVLWKNRAVAQTLFYEGHDDLVGRPLVDLVEPAERERFIARMRTPATETPAVEEARLLRRDGQVVVTEVFPTQVVAFEGKPARMIVGRDATERVRLQQQLLVAARMASIGMLAAGVAHEVNNPLGYVLNNVEIALKQLGPLGEATRQGREALGVALEGVDRIRTIVRDLLALSRVDDGLVGPVDVIAVVESTLALARNEIAERAELVFDYESIPLARGTVARVGQVLLNLFTNALEALPEGARSTNELRVSVRPSAAGGVVVAVTDNGVGIRPEHASRIFEPFFTTKAAGHGTGLGLAISVRLVAEMGGELSFESVPKRETTFRMTLAAADLEDPRAPASVGSGVVDQLFGMQPD